MYDDQKSYGKISRFFHWSIGFSIIGLLAAGFVMTNMDKSSLKWQIYGMHKAFGITILLLAVIRIIWRICHIKPKLPDNYPLWQKFASSFTHKTLYVLTLLMPASGWVMSMAANHIPSWFGLFQLRLPIQPSKSLAKIASNTHEILAWIIIVLLVLHILAAISNKNILHRMWGTLKSS